jgi:hypothetical protein
MGEAAAPAPLPPGRETALRGGGLAAALRELLSHYISLEEYWVEEAVAKAVTIDEARPGSATSSVVDDAFFVALSAGRRALATGRAPSAVAVLNAVNAALSSTYHGALAAALAGAGARLAAAAPAAPGAPLSAAAAAAAAPLNNAEVSAGYAGKLREQLEGLAGRAFAAPHDRDRVSLVLADLSKTAADFRALAARGADGAVAALAPRLRPALDAAAAAPYELDASAAAEAPPPGAGWPAALVAAFAVHVGWLREALAPAAYEAVAGALLDRAVARLEAAVAQRRFTQLGGLQLERDVRALVAGLGGLTARGARERLARLGQTAAVLGVESAAEAAELAAEGAAGWRLSLADVRAALAQRVDLDAREVATVRL